MPLFQRDSSKHPDSRGDERDEPAPRGSSADAEDSAAHIAELVRRTAERQARPSPSCIVLPDVSSQQPSVPEVASAPEVPPAPGGRQAAQPLAQPPAQPDNPSPAVSMHLPSRRTLVAVGAAAAVLIGGGLGMSHSFGSNTEPTSTDPGSSATAPAGYSVKVTDVITDCASHARGSTKSAFEEQNCVKAQRSLATGQVSGRPTLFVVSRIEMASPEEAATIKAVLDGTGTGNLNDLLREGRSFPGSPDKMSSSGYNSMQSGKIVTVAEAGFVDSGRSSNVDPALRSAAAQVAALVSAQG